MKLKKIAGVYDQDAKTTDNKFDDTLAKEFREACKEDNLATVEKLLKNKKLDVNARDEKYLATALNWAAFKGCTAVVKRLLADERVDPNLAAKKGYTPLMEAVRENNMGAVRVLLKCTRVDLEATDDCGQSALDLANREILTRRNCLEDAKQIKEAVARGRSEAHEKDAEIKKLQERIKELEGGQPGLTLCDIELPGKLPETTAGLSEVLKSTMALQEKVLEQIKRLNECCVCMNAPNDTALAPCGHKVCSKCEPRLRKCPLCRARINRTVTLKG